VSRFSARILPSAFPIKCVHFDFSSLPCVSTSLENKSIFVMQYKLAQRGWKNLCNNCPAPPPPDVSSAYCPWLWYQKGTVVQRDVARQKMIQSVHEYLAYSAEMANASYTLQTELQMLFLSMKVTMLYQNTIKFYSMYEGPY
jgi:hypothetical protein